METQLPKRWSIADYTYSFQNSFTMYADSRAEKSYNRTYCVVLNFAGSIFCDLPVFSKKIDSHFPAGKNCMHKHYKTLVAAIQRWNGISSFSFSRETRSLQIIKKGIKERIVWRHSNEKSNYIYAQEHDVNRVEWLWVPPNYCFTTNYACFSLFSCMQFNLKKTEIILSIKRDSP